jgi:lactobin A/cerein 7B family class IIb bacteriocin
MMNEFSAVSMEELTQTEGGVGPVIVVGATVILAGVAFFGGVALGTIVRDVVKSATK